MKQTFRTTLVTFVAVATVAFIGCTDEEIDDNGTPSGNGTEQPASVGWVDLGLPSGLLWADCNVGANAPEESGDHLSWGEVQPKSNYSWSTYAYGSDENKLTKYCNNSEYGLNGFTDNLVTLQPSDDVATARLGNGARTPTDDDWNELFDNTTVEWTTLNGVHGRKFTATNGKSLFLPATGVRNGSELYFGDSYGYYWSASLFVVNPSHGALIIFHSNEQGLYANMRYIGACLRAVRASQN